MTSLPKWRVPKVTPMIVVGAVALGVVGAGAFLGARQRLRERKRLCERSRREADDGQQQPCAKHASTPKCRKNTCACGVERADAASNRQSDGSWRSKEVAVRRGDWCAVRTGRDQHDRCRYHKANRLSRRRKCWGCPAELHERAVHHALWATVIAVALGGTLIGTAVVRRAGRGRGHRTRERRTGRSQPARPKRERQQQR